MHSCSFPKLQVRKFCYGIKNTEDRHLHQLLQAVTLLGSKERRVQVIPVFLVIVVIVVRADARLCREKANFKILLYTEGQGMSK